MKLIHPIYLDVPMMVSFAAAIEGGVAFEKEVVSSHESTNEKGASIRTKFGLSALFESLFDAGIEGELKSATEKISGERNTERRAHTESSIAILLYDALNKNEGYLVKPKTAKELQSMAHGSLIELSGELRKNAIDSMIDAIDVIMILSSMGEEDPEGAIDNELEGLGKGLREDRSRTPLSNVVLQCDTPEDLKAVVTLRTENLRDLTLSELHKNKVRVVGKVTRSISSKQSMSPFENYGLSMMEAGTLSKIVKGLEDSEGVNVELGDVEIQGPAVQVLPLMVFV